MSEELLAALKARWPQAAQPVPGAMLHALELDSEHPHRDDVLLAWGCAGGDPAALRTLEETALGPAARHLRGRRLAAEEIDDVLQSARERLLTGGAESAGILAYRGRGPLAAFVRTVTVRLAIDAHRRHREESTDEIGALVDAGQRNAELEYMRQRYARELTSALTRAWAQLPNHDRFILGLELREHLGPDEIARIYGVHRATATRRLASARAALVAGTRSALRQALGVGESTLASILRVITTSVAWAVPPEQ